MSSETMKNNRYHVLRSLGSGSTGEVYLVEDNVNNRQEVILKLLHAYAYPATLDAQNAPQSFDFEARAVAQLRHPNILPLLDYGQETIDGNIVPYIVTPFCPEGSLATWLVQRSDSDVLTLQELARLVRQIADALQYAHNQGVVHRDVKTANVFIHNNLNGPPDTLVDDFGFAKPLPGTLSRGLDVRGTPTSMAPEQWEGQVVPASDQYALGVLVYQLLTGRLPFEGSIEQLRYEHLNSWPTPPSVINPTLSREVDAVVGRALAKTPGERYPTVSSFADAFTQAIQPAPVVPEPVYLPPPPPTGMNVGNVPPQPEPRALPTWMIVLIAVLVLLLLLGGGLLIANAFSNNSANSAANATATANTYNTATAQANANTNATTTANTNATATAQANSNANATATASASTHATATAQANAHATATVLPAAQLSGNWTNNDPNTQGITKLNITNKGVDMTVQAFARCPPSPNDCNWGTQSGPYQGSPFPVVFVVNGSTESLAISLNNTQGTQLKVVDNSSTNGTNTYYFSKS